MADKTTPTLAPRWAWRSGSLDLEHFTEPSMVEPVHNLTIEEILRDYSRGIVHPSRPVLYDEGDDIQEVDQMDDILDLMSDSLHGTTHIDSPIDEIPPEPSDALASDSSSQE